MRPARARSTAVPTRFRTWSTSRDASQLHAAGDGRVRVGYNRHRRLMAQTMFRNALLLAVPIVLAAQEPAPIRVNVREVVVPVTVTDAEGRFVSDLKQPDFEVYDQGYKQDIRFFSAERSQPVVVGFLMELSNGMRVRWKNYQEMGVELALQLLPGDPKYSGYLIGFGNTAEVLVNTTSNSEGIVAKLNKVSPAGGSALYDAIWTACTNRKLVPGEPLEPH